MKLKSLAMTIAAGGLFAAAGPCFAIPCTGLTIATWTTCTDSDSDSTWTLVSATVPGSTLFILTELELPTGDLYNAAFDFPATPALAAGETISYTVTSNSADRFNAANFDTTVTEAVGVSGAVATSHITNPPGALNLLLTSTDGSHAPPPAGESPFTSTLTLAVTDTIVTIPTGAVYDAANNSFQTSRVPEPISLALVGVALAGMGLVRRKRKLA